ncbi:MAG TPA: FAD:protein FMN transferase [Gemmatimonadales bacterium]
MTEWSALCLATAAMGTRFELVLGGPHPESLRPAGETALEEIELWHRRLSRFATDSLISHLNRTASKAPVRLDGETFALFTDALRVFRDSDGAFDLAVAPLMERHGFAPSAVPGLEWVSSTAIRLDSKARTFRFTCPGVSLDLSAIGKGHALDCAATLLRAHGVGCALLHGGTSSVVAIGAPPGEPGWRVALGPQGRAGTVTLRNEALSVSDASSQTARAGGHIVDARSGCPAAWQGIVAVIGPSARLCDAWSTALVALGVVPPTFPRGYQALRHQGALSRHPHSAWNARYQRPVQSTSTP